MIYQHYKRENRFIVLELKYNFIQSPLEGIKFYFDTSNFQSIPYATI